MDSNEYVTEYDPDNPKRTVYISQSAADANWTQIMAGYLEEDGITPTQKGRELNERLDALSAAAEETAGQEGGESPAVV